MTQQVKIDPRKFYTLYEIVKEGLIPGIDSTPKAARLMQSDAFTNNVLKAQRVQRGSFGMQYRVKGSNIINFLAQQDNG